MGADAGAVRRAGSVGVMTPLPRVLAYLAAHPWSSAREIAVCSPGPASLAPSSVALMLLRLTKQGRAESRRQDEGGCAVLAYRLLKAPRSPLSPRPLEARS